jgi:hypothetical protein
MYYYTLAQLFHWDENAQKNDPNYPHAKKNITIFLLGSVAYIFTAAFLFSKMYQTFIDGVFILAACRDWFQWFLLVDVFACAILFKQYWGFGILTTVDGVLETKKSKETTKETNVNELINKPEVINTPVADEIIDEIANKNNNLLVEEVIADDNLFQGESLKEE